MLAVAAYFTRAYWWAPVRGLAGGASTPAEADTVARWEPVTPAGAERGEKQVRALAAPRGPAYVTLHPGDLASYAFLSLANTLPPSARDAQATVVGERVYVRAVVSLRDFAGALGAMGGLLADRDTLRLGGTFEVMEPGRAAFHVQDVQLGALPLPPRTIPPLVRRVRRGTPRPGLAPDALDVPIPEYIGDVRVARGRITLYKRR
ncbi:MAG: hypothetical protein JO180_12190 [Gemmatirosa sp.]|nr:hypothetical protein [Gemmatirosa sp.]